MNLERDLTFGALLAMACTIACGNAGNGAAGGQQNQNGSGGDTFAAGGNSPGNGGTSTGNGGAGSGNGGSNTGNGGSNTGNGGTGPGSGGTGGGSGGSSGSSGGGKYTVDPIGNQNRAPGYVDLTPPMGEAFPDTGDSITSPPPTGWVWHNVDGAVCRDGSPTGLYIHKGTADKLVIYLEGGGACSNDAFCGFNPKNVQQVLAGDGQQVIGSAAGAIAGQQMPGVYTNGTGVQGMFNTTVADNPYKDWNIVYVPYCTGDVFFGTKKDASVPTTLTGQQFVGYDDMKLFIGRLVPTFKDKVTQVVLTGASAGGFGAALNFSMVQDAFGDVPVIAVDDSGPPFDDKYMPVCMQKRWRDSWGFDGSFPPDCDACRQADGGGMLHMADFLMKKHPKARIAMVSSIHDEVIRLFYSPGLQNCLNYDTANPVAIVVAQADPNTYFPAQQYQDGLNDLRTKYVSTNRFSTYYMAGTAPADGYHQHVFRTRFYDQGGTNPTSGAESIAQFVTKFINGTIEQVGP